METKPINRVELIAKGGQFIITHEDGITKVKGRFSMYALDRFCQLKKLESYLELVTKLTSGMRIVDYADLILVAIQDYFRDNPEQSGYTRDKIIDIIDEEWGGVKSQEFWDLMRHAAGRLLDTKPTPIADEKKVPETNEEKKSELPES